MRAIIPKILIIILGIYWFSNSLHAQTYGNEWIAYHQKYYTFKVVNTGIQRIGFDALNTALAETGDDISTINTANFQVFGRESEVAILIQDGGDGQFNSGDYIEFYAQKNDGWLDSLLFDNPVFIGDSYYSLVNDTINYFFTWNNSTANKRIQVETDVAYSTYPEQAYCWKKNYHKHTDLYAQGSKFQGLSSPKYTSGEGWMSPTFSTNQVLTSQVTTSNVYNGNSQLRAFGEAVSASVSSSSYTGAFNHNTQLLFGSSNTLIADTSYTGYHMIKKAFDVPLSLLGNNQTAIKHRITNIGQTSDIQQVSSVTLFYPHTFNFENQNYFEFGLPANTFSSKYHISVSNVQGSNPFIYVLGNTLKKIPMVNQSGEWKAVLPNTTQDSIKAVLVDAANIQVINSVQPINASAQFNDYRVFTATNPFLIITHQRLMSGAQDYATYRAAAGYDTLIADIQELYYQFGGGIEKHPLSIRRFCKQAIELWPNEPGHLFIIGKSVRDVNESSLGSRQDAAAFARNLVPSYGYPSSDNHFTVGLELGMESFAVPTGRLSVTQNFQIQEYLSKVMAYEQEQVPYLNYTIPDKEWQKNVLHFGGGTDSAEQVLLNSFLSGFESIIEDTLFGGVVKSYTKDPTSSVINTADFFSVQEDLEEGVSLITFFGHASSGGGFSQNIDSPNNWNNDGKYPLVIGLGCYTGDVHQPDTNSYAEQLIRPTNEGAIAFISTVKLGFVTYIGNYTQFLYRDFANGGYGETIGQQMKNTVDTLYQIIGSSSWDVIQESNFNGMSLQGDPALKINSHLAPEIVLDESRVWSIPSQIDLSVDTFDLYVVASNIGAAFVDSFNIEVTRTFPNGADSVYSKIVPGLLNRDTIVFRLPTYHNVAIGANNFTIKADLPTSGIVEHTDEFINNQVNFTNYVISNGLLPIWPYDYAIIPNKQEVLKASTVNPFERLRNYVFEIDTTDLFNSPFKKEQRNMSEGGVIEALPSHWLNSNTQLPEPLEFTDSTVYYWRCSPDSSVKDWLESSFQYIPNKWGWGQSHFFQFKNNTYTNIEYNRPNRTFDFQPSAAKINVSTKIHLNSHWSSPEPQATLWKISGETQDYGGYVWPAIHIGIIDPVSLKGWRTPFDYGGGDIQNPDHCFGQFNGDPSICSSTITMGRNRTHGMFIFNYNNPDEMDSLATFLTNKVPDGHYIIAYSYIPNNYTSPMSLNGAMPNALYTALQQLGFTGFNPSNPDDGFILFCEKGNPSSAQEVHSTPMAGGVTYPGVESLDFETIIQGSNVQGYINSTVAGPAYEWDVLYWKQHPQEQNTGDSTLLRLYGITNAGNEIQLLDTLMTAYDSVISLQNLVDASIYPNVRLEAWEIDSTTFTPAQIERWQLIYSPIPECAVNPKKGFYYSIQNDSIQEGDSLSFALAIENVSAFDMDSLKVNYWIEDQSHVQNSITYDRQDSLRSGEVLLDTITISTIGYPGLNSIWLTANPKNGGGAQDQMEQFYFNNFAQKPFVVQSDITNPILDVTFDGVHILNEDIISPEPNIVITLDDENPFLLLNEDLDTANIQLALLRPNSNTYEVINYIENGQENLKWYPANSTENKFTIEYNPIFAEDGIYKLKVQGKDKSSNFSGDLSYEIAFEVINQSTITNVYNYPNPFSTKTHFVFTLTGKELPDDFQIRIMTVTGKVVREIGIDEIGAIKIGNNKTEFFWDGKDQYGSQLANGVYLYKVTANINGESIERRATSGDHAFKHQIGKMYLLR
ncbi:MAG: C25 family cysteine peptidase [Flavobacteriales bacterium]|jgi:hypothetical protein|nr:C25 family cysteine peptidase [Flavobacteriales bacterium]